MKRILLLFLLSGAVAAYWFLGIDSSVPIGFLAVTKGQFALLLAALLSLPPVILTLSVKTFIKKSIAESIKDEFKREFLKYESYYKSLPGITEPLNALLQVVADTRTRVKAESIEFEDIDLFSSFLNEKIGAFHNIYSTNKIYYQAFVDTEKISKITKSLINFKKSNPQRIRDFKEKRGEAQSGVKKQAILREMEALISDIEQIINVFKQGTD